MRKKCDCWPVVRYLSPPLHFPSTPLPDFTDDSGSTMAETYSNATSSHVIERRGPEKAILWIKNIPIVKRTLIEQFRVLRFSQLHSEVVEGRVRDGVLLNLGADPYFTLSLGT